MRSRFVFWINQDGYFVSYWLVGVGRVGLGSTSKSEISWRMSMTSRAAWRLSTGSSWGGGMLVLEVVVWTGYSVLIKAFVWIGDSCTVVMWFDVGCSEWFVVGFVWLKSSTSRCGSTEKRICSRYSMYRTT